MAAERAVGTADAVAEDAGGRGQSTTSPRAAEPLLEVTGLSKRFEHRPYAGTI